MLIEGTSRYYLKKIRAKAKMYEYHIPNELHSTTEERVNELIISAIAIIGDFSDVIISNIEGEPFDYKDFQDNLRFAAKFFDGYVESKLYFGDQEYYLLLGAVVYYLCNHNGSSQVLCSRISSDIDLGVSGIDAVLTQILKGDKNVLYNGKYEIVSEICRSYNHFLESGTFEAYGELAVFRRYIYELGSDREVLFADALIAVIYLKIKNSAYELMPQYTEIEFEAWKNVISQGTLVTELWQAQRELGKRGVFWGTSATIQMPTSSGKTKSIALIILSAFLSKRTNYAIVVAPFRSLCREITEELKKAFSFDDSIHVNELSDVLQMDFMDIILGNREMDGDKGVYIVTPEKLLFVLRQNIHILSNVGLMIFDERHLFDDSSRGITYELLISTIKLYMTDETQKVLISAVIPNAEEINEWLTDGQGEVIKSNAIQTTEKTVSIAEIKYNRENNKRYAYLYFVNPDNPDEEEFYVPRVITQVNIKLHKRETKERVFPEINNGKNTHKNDIALALAINLCINGGTAIFCGRKDTADGLLNRILDITNRGYDISNLIKCAEKEEVEKLSKLIAMNLGSDSIYFSAAKIGAFVHHGGIPMGIRCSVEYAMQMGLIGFLACTSTLAQGVNLPIRYLIIPTIYQGKDRIKVRDFQNLIGRAGRAGIYTEGNIILSETNVYRYKNANYENWKWLNYKELLNSNQAEACTSELLSWIRADDEMEQYLNRIIEIFETHYESEDFAETVNSFLEDLKLEKEETYRKADFIVHQMLNNIEAIESFLLFYLMEDTYEEAKDTIHEIIEETLAFHLAKENERERLLHITDLIGSFIVKVVNTSDKRNRYSKSLLGVRKEIEIEQWVQGHIFEIRTCKNEEDILTMIFPLLLQTDNSLIRACNKPELLLEVGLNWIKGINYHDIHEAAIVSGIRILARNKYKLISINQTINFCDNYFGYDCILTLAAIIENVSYSCDDMDLDYNFKMLSKRLKYGLQNQCAITIYEMGFSDRFVAGVLSDIIESEYKAGSRKEVLRLIKQNENVQNEVLSFLEEYPAYFEDKIRSMIEN